MKRLLMMVMFSMMSLALASDSDSEFAPYFTGNGIDEKGRNMLHLMALMCNQGEEVNERMLKAGANVLNINFRLDSASLNLKDANGQTPMDIVKDQLDKIKTNDDGLWLAHLSPCRGLEGIFLKMERDRKTNNQ